MPYICVVYVFLLVCVNVDESLSNIIKCIAIVEASMFIMQYVKYIIVTKYSNEQEEENIKINDN